MRGIAAWWGATEWHAFSHSEVVAHPRAGALEACADFLLTGGVHEAAGVPLQRRCAPGNTSMGQTTRPGLATRMQPGEVVKVQIGLHLGHGRKRGLGRGVPRDGADTFIGVAAPCEVLVSEVTGTQATFCYRALPGHPVAGEERFHLQWIPTEGIEGGGRLVATVSAYSRPVAWYTKWGGPVARAAQRYFAKRYARAMLARA